MGQLLAGPPARCHRTCAASFLTNRAGDGALQGPEHACELAETLANESPKRGSERPTSQAFHHHEGRPIREPIEVEHLHDVGVLKARGDLDLFEELRRELRQFRELRKQYLHRAPDELLFHDVENDAHASLAKLAADNPLGTRHGLANRVLGRTRRFHVLPSGQPASARRRSIAATHSLAHASLFEGNIQFDRAIPHQC